MKGVNNSHERTHLLVDFAAESVKGVQHDEAFPITDRLFVGTGIGKRANSLTSGFYAVLFRR